ncbi:MAG: YwaF family protein [Holdemanella porci]|jgi:hypothetical protein|uniref:TMEM164 family acyltransferase n=1 Tax=Erysipelotrichaceae TaxID=128827 RepID=UPI00156A0399|nr:MULTISPECIES: YwaF family protein [Erysipelotrichaceae]MDD6452777.1 YwaF family protein [Holdemanella porci]MDD6459778.1 YwaF family protein [Absicoccus porci]MEE1355548.1 YwaF family protein [Absicoccus porci]
MTKKQIHFFRISAWILCVLEIWKQIYLTYVVGHYLWWHFPFQICSIPMYLCFAIGYGKKKYQNRLLCYLMTYSTVGAWAGLLGCPFLVWPRFIFNLHSYFWHIYIVFVGWVAGHIWMQTKRDLNDFKQSTYLYFAFCLIAYFINQIVYPFAGINLFYLNPKVEFNLPIYRDFIPYIGYSWTIFIYLTSVVCFSLMTLNIWFNSSSWYKQNHKNQESENMKTVHESE